MLVEGDGSNPCITLYHCVFDSGLKLCEEAHSIFRNANDRSRNNLQVTKQEEHNSKDKLTGDYCIQYNSARSIQERELEEENVLDELVFDLRIKSSVVIHKATVLLVVKEFEKKYQKKLRPLYNSRD